MHDAAWIMDPIAVDPVARGDERIAQAAHADR
jgi:hypothetical protein